MDAPLRVCVVEAKGVMEVPNIFPVGPVFNTKPYFKGKMSSALDLMVDIIWTEPFNFTFQTKHHFGVDGCEGSIARNESDVSLCFVEYPVHADFSQVNPWLVLFEEPLAIYQMYNKTNHRLADISKTSMKSFKPSVWMSVLILIIVMGLLMKIPQMISQFRQKDEERHYSIFETFCCFVQQDYKDYPDSFRRILCLLVSLSSLILITGYFRNLISTDMVVVEKPNVITSYQDIIHRPKVIPTFFRQLSEYENFRDAPKDSKNYEFWHLMTLRASESQMIPDPTEATTMGLLMFEGYLGKRVLIASSWIEEGVRATACRLKYAAGITGVFTYAAVDPESPRYTKGMLFRQVKLPILEKAMKRGRRVFEGGFVQRMKRHLAGGVLLEEMMEGRETHKLTDHMRQCMSRNLVIDKPAYQAAKLHNFDLLGKIAAVFLVFSFVTLAAETAFYHWKYGGRRQPIQNLHVY